MINNSVINSNQARLRDAANRLLQSVGSDNNLITLVKPQVESLIAQVQSFLSGGGQVALNINEFSQLNPSLIGQFPKNTCDEKQRIALRMNGFDLKENHIWEELTKRFGSNIKRGELTNIAKVLAEAANIKLDRDAKRRKSVLLKWFDEHWDTIYPLLDYVVFSETEGDENGEKSDVDILDDGTDSDEMLV